MAIVTTKRVSINRPPRSKFTPAALEAFCKMRTLENKCACKDDYNDCPACGQWWDLHKTLHGEFATQALAMARLREAGCRVRP
jgi:hypothetical protein